MFHWLIPAAVILIQVIWQAVRQIRHDRAVYDAKCFKAIMQRRAGGAPANDH